MKIGELLKLSPSKRILLAQQLWDSVPAEDIPLSNSIKKELDVRLQAHEKEEMKYYTREELREKLSEG